jgi:hypothetical protein
MLDLSPATTPGRTADSTHHTESDWHDLSDMRSALSFGVAAAGQCGAALALRRTEALAEASSQNATAALAEEVVSLNGYGSIFKNNFVRGLRGEFDGPVAKLLPPLLVGALATYGTVKIAEAYSDCQKGDHNKEARDFSDGSKYYSATLGAAIGTMAATQFGVSRQLGAAVGMVVGEYAYSGSHYAIENSLKWLGSK